MPQTRQQHQLNNIKSFLSHTSTQSGTDLHLLDPQPYEILVEENSIAVMPTFQNEKEGFIFSEGQSVRNEGPKIKAQMAKAGVKLIGGSSEALRTSYGVWECCMLPQWGPWQRPGHQTVLIIF